MRLRFLSTCCIAALALPASVQAQSHSTMADAADDASDTPTQNTAQGEIVVTGSRIARRDYVSDSPIITQSADQLRNSGNVNIEAALNRLPQFVPGQGAHTPAQGGRATLNLRGLGENRNLVLLDGRRLPPATALGTININIIPTDILSGVETISGGASATYGSEATSGVINFKSRKAFDGIDITLQKGITERGDVPQTSASVTMGTVGSDGNILLSLGYYDRKALEGADRDFYRLAAPSSFIFGGVYAPDARNLPNQAAVNAVFAGYGPGTAARTSPFGFNDDGTLFAQIGSANYRRTPSAFEQRIGGNILSPLGSQQSATAAQTRYSLFLKGEQHVSDAVTVYAQGLYVDDHTRGFAGHVPSLNTTMTIPVTNPFIPNDLRTLLASRPDPTAPFSYNRRFEMLPKRTVDYSSSTYQLLLGAQGPLGVGDLKWDIYGSKGRTRTVDSFLDEVLQSRANTLLAAPDGGNSICQGGFNPFGIAVGATLSSQCRSFLTGDSHSITVVSQDVVEGQIQGSLMPLGSRSVQFAVSANYRRDSYDFSPDAGVISGDFMAIVRAQPAEGRRSVKEIAGELLIPLLTDRPFFKSLDLNLGYRYSRYSISGGASTYKASLAWEPTNGILFRGGYERAIRAPGLAELYSNGAGSVVIFGVPPVAGDPCDSRSAARAGVNGAALRALCVATGVPSASVDTYQYPANGVITSSSGSTDLVPEVVDTITAGAVLRPLDGTGGFGRLSLSFDYYDIRLDHAISTIPAGTVINKCYNLDGSNSAYSVANFYCGFLNRDSFGAISVVSTPYLNLGGIHTSGIDFQMDWSIGLGPNDRYGALSVGIAGNWLINYDISQLPGNPFVAFHNTIDSTPATGLVLPRWKSQVNIGYEFKPVQVALTWQHIPAIRDITAVTNPARPSPGVPAYDRFDLRLGVEASKALKFTAIVNNLTDRRPPVVAGTPGLTQPGTYDVYGRSFMMSLRASF